MVQYYCAIILIFYVFRQNYLVIITFYNIMGNELGVYKEI